MKKILLSIFGILLFAFAHAQDTDSVRIRTDYSKIDLSNRPNDHFMIQYGYDGWLNTPDSATPSGFSRHFNFYFMYDKPLKTNPHLSLAIGLGLGSSNMFFKDTYINLKSPTEELPFQTVNSANHYKKYKLTTIYGEVPLEFRYVSNPVSHDKGFKAALGLKIGTLLKSYTKGKNLLDASGRSVYGEKYINKEQAKNFINTNRFAATARFGYGILSIDGSYQLNNFLKQGAGAAFHPYSIGLTLSGL